jgi:K+-sensing histidine kinase KdpD
VNISVETVRFLLVVNSITYVTFFLIVVISFHKLKKIRNENVNHENNLKVILHDLKSPITSYQGLADIISFLIKNKQFDKIELISKQIDDYGSKLLNIFLDLQIRASSRSKSVNFLEKSCLLETTYPLLQTYRHIASISGVDITENYNLQAMIYTNPYLFQTIYRNLLDNAIKNSKPGSSIEIAASEKGGKVFFSVTNIPPTLNYHKIDEMTQFLNSPGVITAFSGKRMGLSIIKKYCKLLDINIIIRSECPKVIFELEVPTSPNKQGFIPNYRKLFSKYHKNWEVTTEKQSNRFKIT